MSRFKNTQLSLKKKNQPEFDARPLSSPRGFSAPAAERGEHGSEATLTFRSGNSSRWAPCCWPPSPVNPVRTPAGSTIHWRFLDTPFQPWPRANVAPFNKRNGRYFLRVSFLFSVIYFFPPLYLRDAFGKATPATIDVRLRGGREVRRRLSGKLACTSWIHSSSVSTAKDSRRRNLFDLQQKKKKKNPKTSFSCTSVSALNSAPTP